MATQVKGVATLQQLIAASAVLATLSLAACGGSSGDSGTDTDINGADTDINGADTDSPVPPEEPEDLIPEPVVSVEALAIDQTDAAGIIELLEYRMPAVNGGVTIALSLIHI